MKPFNIEWRSNEGYGDYITGVNYAHSSTIKYQRPVKINFHWPNPKDSLFSEKDFETIQYRFDETIKYLKPVDTLTIEHTYNSKPSYRFINELEEFNPVHGLWYTKEKLDSEHGLIAHWSSIHNATFPGHHKDPLYNHWNELVKKLRSIGFRVEEITYRTPIKEAMEILTRCEFGLGYEGMVHQYFKFLWKPSIIASQRVSLAHLLCPTSCIVTEPKKILKHDIYDFVKDSKKRLKKYKDRHHKYMNDFEDPTQHKLYNLET